MLLASQSGREDVRGVVSPSTKSVGLVRGLSLEELIAFALMGLAGSFFSGPEELGGNVEAIVGGTNRQ